MVLAKALSYEKTVAWFFLLIGTSRTKSIHESHMHAQVEDTRDDGGTMLSEHVVCGRIFVV
jgi:hypothetical protein